jgi:surface protein
LTHFFQGEENDLQKRSTTMSENTDREKQFQLTPAVIEANKCVLQQMPLDELSKIFIQEGLDPRTHTKLLIDSIMENRLIKHHPIIEERYQFVIWLYRIRAQHGNHYGFLQPDFICIIFGKMMVSKYRRSDADIHEAVNDWCDDAAKATAKYGHISKWNTSLVTNMKGLFSHKRNFNNDISKWDVSNVTIMRGMFSCYIKGQETVSAFNGDISKWDVSKVTTMKCMFQCAVSFNGDISGWDVRNVTNMRSMFSRAASFNGDISGWDVSNVTDMRYMFNGYKEGQEAVSAFNGDISKWNVSKVTNMRCMFQCAVSFNGDISGWDVSNVTNMRSMFQDAVSFNGNISGWDVSNVTNMSFMFTRAISFNGDISGWDVSNVTDMSFMFDCYIPGQEDVSAFNGDISKWNVSKVTNMKNMFQCAVSFNGDISGWDVRNVTNMENMFTDCPISEEHKPNFVKCGGRC